MQFYDIFILYKKISDSNPTFKKDEHGNLFDADYSKAAYDLALLSNCNHTIVSRGTYSLWGKYFWFKNFLNCKYFFFHTYFFIFYLFSCHVGRRRILYRIWSDCASPLTRLKIISNFSWNQWHFLNWHIAIKNSDRQFRKKITYASTKSSSVH